MSGESSRPAAEQDDWHARWLAMQSAYAEYRKSSEALECTRRSGDDPVLSDQVRLTLLEGQQRLAFERYIDARIGFLESRIDESNRGEAARGAAEGPSADCRGEESRIKAWLSIASGRPALQTLGVALLCTMAFSLMREQTRINSLEAGRDDLRVALLRTGQEIQQLQQRLDASNPPSAPLSQQTRRSPAGPTTLKPFAPPRPAGRKPAAGRSVAHQRQPQKGEGPGQTLAGGTGNRHTDRRPGYAFSLSPSREFQRVGPLKVLVRSVNAQRGTASLEIATASQQVDVQSLRLNQPVWLTLSGYDHPVGLIAEKITGNRLEGHLWETAGGKRDLRASQARPRLDSTP